MDITVIENDSWLQAQWPVSLTWHGLTCSTRGLPGTKSKQLLHSCSGSAFPGELHAILGPSGAGLPCHSADAHSPSSPPLINNDIHVDNNIDIKVKRCPAAAL